MNFIANALSGGVKLNNLLMLIVAWFNGLILKSDNKPVYRTNIAIAKWSTSLKLAETMKFILQR